MYMCGHTSKHKNIKSKTIIHSKEPIIHKMPSHSELRKTTYKKCHRRPFVLPFYLWELGLPLSMVNLPCEVTLENFLFASKCQIETGSLLGMGASVCLLLSALRFESSQVLFMLPLYFDWHCSMSEKRMHAKVWKVLFFRCHVLLFLPCFG